MINSLRLTPDNELLIAACQLRPKNLQLNILWQPRWAPVHPLRIPRSIPQYLTIPHKTSQYYHSTSSVNSATINQTLRLSRTLEKGPPTHPPPIRNPAFPIAKSPFSRPGPSRGTDQLTIFDLFDAHWVFCLSCKRLFFNYSIFNLFDVTICDHIWAKVRYFSRNISEVIFLTTLVR